MNDDQQLSDNMTALRMLGEMGIIDPLSAAFGVARLYLHKGLDALTQEANCLRSTGGADTAAQVRALRRLHSIEHAAGRVRTGFNAL